MSRRAARVLARRVVTPDPPPTSLDAHPDLLRLDCDMRRVEREHGRAV